MRLTVGKTADYRTTYSGRGKRHGFPDRRERYDWRNFLKSAYDATRN
jgi:hypothetical protein